VVGASNNHYKLRSYWLLPALQPMLDIFYSVGLEGPQQYFLCCEKNLILFFLLMPVFFSKNCVFVFNIGICSYGKLKKLWNNQYTITKINCAKTPRPAPRAFYIFL